VTGTVSLKPRNDKPLWVSGTMPTAHCPLPTNITWLPIRHWPVLGTDLHLSQGMRNPYGCQTPWPGPVFSRTFPYVPLRTGIRGPSSCLSGVAFPSPPAPKAPNRSHPVPVFANPGPPIEGRHAR